MSNLIRWEPEREMMTLREAMNHLFDEAFTPMSMIRTMGAPSVDLYQTDDDIVVRASLPGMKAEDVQISITGEMLTIKGEFKEKQDKKEKSYHLRERHYGTFERTLTLPGLVQADKAQAEFEDGILTITLPKSEAIKPKSITVKAR
jgi:HSP20 family protein